MKQTRRDDVTNRFSTYRLLPLKFNPKDLRFTKDFEIKIADVDDFYQLEEASSGIFQRFFFIVFQPASSRFIDFQIFWSRDLPYFEFL